MISVWKYFPLIQYYAKYGKLQVRALNYNTFYNFRISLVLGSGRDSTAYIILHERKEIPCKAFIPPPFFQQVCHLHLLFQRIPQDHN